MKKINWKVCISVTVMMVMGVSMVMSCGKVAASQAQERENVATEEEKMELLEKLKSFNESLPKTGMVTPQGETSGEPGKVTDEEIGKMAEVYAAEKGQVSEEQRALGREEGLSEEATEVGAMIGNYMGKVVKGDDRPSKGELTEPEVEIIDAPEMRKGLKALMEDPDRDEGTSQMTHAVMTLMQEAMEESCETPEDMEKIVKYYTAAVKDTNALTSDEKMELEMFLSTALYTFKALF